MVQIVEVSPRDGLQNESVQIATADKVDLIRQLVDAGVTRIEATSFVDGRRVPQMADAAEVMAAVPRLPTVSYAGLVLNPRGAERAIEAGVDELNVVVICTDAFGLRNQNADVPGMVQRYRDIAAVARSHGRYLTLTLGAAFGCPFEGEVTTSQVAAVLDLVRDDPPDEIALADTIGVGVPGQVDALARAALERLPGATLRFHFHNTRNTGYANAIAAVAAGATALDSSAGGIGGCPFAPNATGNIATEDLLYLLHRSGHPTGIDQEIVARIGGDYLRTLGLEPPAMLGRAGLFPPPAGDAGGSS